jgi:hypothetical protein
VFLWLGHKGILTLPSLCHKEWLSGAFRVTLVAPDNSQDDWPLRTTVTSREAATPVGMAVTRHSCRANFCFPITTLKNLSSTPQDCLGPVLSCHTPEGHLET